MEGLLFARIRVDTNSRYVGDVLYGKRHGVGSFTACDGSCYTGEWKEGCRHGQVTLAHLVRDTQGRLEHPSGDVYEGQWENNLRHGHGVMRYA